MFAVALQIIWRIGCSAWLQHADYPEWIDIIVVK